MLGKLEHARGALRSVVPAALAKALDWQTLTLRPSSFVDLALKEQHTDLLYSAAWKDVVREVVRAPNGVKALAQVLCYLLEVSEHVEREALTALLERELGPEAKEAIVTAGQQLIEQGRQQGIEQGRQQGIEQGRQQGLQQGIRQGECALLLRLLRQRFGDEVNAQVERRVAVASVEQLESWTGRVLTAVTLSELLAD